MAQRILPYVETETLDEVIGRLESGRMEYLKAIFYKAHDENPLLQPFEEFIPCPSLAIEVYELLSLSLTEGRKLPCVELSALVEAGIPQIDMSPIDDTKIIVFPSNLKHILEDRNLKVVEFLKWVNSVENYPLSFYGGLTIYSALRLQAQRDKINREIRSN